jgi:hypothetical protein
MDRVLSSVILLAVGVSVGCATRNKNQDDNPLAHKKKQRRLAIPLVDNCEVPSFACSGGYYNSTLDFGPHSFSYEKYILSHEKNKTPSQTAEQVMAAKKIAHQKNKFNIVQINIMGHTKEDILSACLKDSCQLNKKSSPYVNFLELYEPALKAGLIDFLFVGEELAPHDEQPIKVVKAILKDMREKKYPVKLGAWPVRAYGPNELNLDDKDVDFFVYDYYEFEYGKVKGDPLHDPNNPFWNSFKQLVYSGKPWFLFLSTTPNAETSIESTLGQIRMANEYNVPIMYFAVAPDNGVANYFRYAGKKYAPFQHLTASLMDLQSQLRAAKKPNAPHLATNFVMGEVVDIREALGDQLDKEKEVTLSTAHLASRNYLTLLNIKPHAAHLSPHLPLTLSTADNAIVIQQLLSEKPLALNKIKVSFGKETPHCQLQAKAAESGIPADIWSELTGQGDARAQIYELAHPHAAHLFRLRLETTTTPCTIENIEWYFSTQT